MEFRVKKQYKPKEDNKEKLKVFLKKIENGKYQHQFDPHPVIVSLELVDWSGASS